jgi:hypothetical protein
METLRKILTIYLISCFCNLSFAQTRYDNWPTLETNDRSKIISKQNNQPMFNPIGRSWNHRIITFSFQNSTLDIS